MTTLAPVDLDELLDRHTAEMAAARGDYEGEGEVDGG